MTNKPIIPKQESCQDLLNEVIFRAGRLQKSQNTIQIQHEEEMKELKKQHENEVKNINENWLGINRDELKEQREQIRGWLLNNCKRDGFCILNKDGLKEFDKQFPTKKKEERR